MSVVDFLLQRAGTLSLVLLLLTRWTSAMPAGLYTPVKREDVEAPVVQDTLTTEAPLEISQLRREVEQLSRELLQTRETLEILRTEMNNKIENVNLLSPAHHEMTCRTDFTWWHEAVGKTLEYLDNFDIHCRHGEFLRQWRMTWGERERKKAIRFVCCKFKSDDETGR